MTAGFLEYGLAGLVPLLLAAALAAGRAVARPVSARVVDRAGACAARLARR